MNPSPDALENTALSGACITHNSPPCSQTTTRQRLCAGYSRDRQSTNWQDQTTRHEQVESHDPQRPLHSSPRKFASYVLFRNTGTYIYLASLRSAVLPWVSTPVGSRLGSASSVPRILRGFPERSRAYAHGNNRMYPHRD